MTDLKKAKENVSKMKSKWNAAEKRLKAAKRNGSEKQIALANKHVTMWKNRYLRAMVELKRAKEAAPSLKERVPVKKAATFTGLAVAVVGLVVAGGVIYDKTRNKDAEAPAIR